MIKVMLAAVAGLGLVACVGQTAPGAGESKPVEDKRFDQAANFTCDDGVKLDVLFYQNGGNDILARADGGAAMPLATDPAAMDGMTWKDAKSSLKIADADATWTVDGKASPCTFAPRSLPPPTATGVVQTLTAADAGKTVTIKVGEKVAVALSGVPTAGYVWAASQPPAWVKASDGPSGATTSAQTLPGFTGGNHWEVVIIEAVAAGEGEITLAQRRPWEDASEPNAETFKFTLKAS